MAESVLFDSGGEPAALDPLEVLAEAEKALTETPPAGAAWLGAWTRLRWLVRAHDRGAETPPRHTAEIARCLQLIALRKGPPAVLRSRALKAPETSQEGP